MSQTFHHRGRVAALARSRSPHDPEFLEAKRDLAAEKIAAYIERTVAAAPPLTREQSQRLASLLHPKAGGADAA